MFLLLPGDSKEEDIQGYGLEPSGPSSAESNDNKAIPKRIPKGIFHLMRHSGSYYKNVPKLYREEGDKDTDVARNRYILVHQGNNYTFTEGCIIVGDTWDKQGKVWDSKTQKYVIVNGKIERENVLGGAWIGKKGPSILKLAEINRFINNKGYQNVKLHILDETPSETTKKRE